MMIRKYNFAAPRNQYLLLKGTGWNRSFGNGEKTIFTGNSYIIYNFLMTSFLEKTYLLLYYIE